MLGHVPDFRGHSVFPSLDGWIVRLREERPDSLGDSSKWALVRLRWVLRYVRNKINKCSPFLVTPSALDSVNNQFPALQNEWNRFRSNPEGHWRQLNNATDAFVIQARLFSDLGGSPDAWKGAFTDYSEQIDGMASAAKQALDGVEGRCAEITSSFQSINSELRSFSDEIISQKQRIDSLITQQGESFTKGEQDRSTQFIASEQGRANQFAASDAERIQTFRGGFEEFRQAADTLVDQHTLILEETRTEAVRRTAETLEKLDGELAKAVKVVGTIVKTTMSGTYEIIANREYTNAWWMRWGAIVSFVGVGVMIIWAVVATHLGEDGINLSTVAIRLSFGFIFVLPGIYCARESSRHWAAEKHNRRIALELASLDPFLAGLDDDKRKEILSEKAREYFGRPPAAEQENEELRTMRSVKIRGDQLLKLVEQVAKIVRPK